MADKCVFLDRDRTITEDPGYLTDPSAVRLLPGADVALRCLAEAGFRLVVVTNQSAIARGMLNEEGLERLHTELRRQLGERGVHLDAIYYCPYHPEGTVEAYTRESDERKPQPGMLLRAARELNLDLRQGWMVGDSPRDVEAGQRAGCRTIRIRLRPDEGAESAEQDEDVQADFTVRNLVDAARIVLRESGGSVRAPSGAAGEAEAAVPALPLGRARLEDMSDSQVLREILHHLRQASPLESEQEFSGVRLFGTIAQVLAVICLAVALVYLPSAAGSYDHQVTVHLALLLAGVLQVMALSLYYMSRRR